VSAGCIARGNAAFHQSAGINRTPPHPSMEKVMYTPDEDEIEQEEGDSSQDATDGTEQAPEQAQATTAVISQRSASSPIIINK
jgi:hypothetical protein